MRRPTLLSRYLIGIATMVGLAAVPSNNAHAAEPNGPAPVARDAPFSGTATLTYTAFDQLIPAQARSDVLKTQQTIVPQPSAADVAHTALDRLQTEIDITRQILGWAIAAALSATDKRTLNGFDLRLQAFDRTVFTIRHRGEPHAVYGPPGFPAPQRHPFKDTVSALQGETGAAQHALTVAEAAVPSPADRKTLQQAGTVFDELIRAAHAMVQG